ncbi:hypothetical protein [Shinella sp. M31]|uniref:hypothetical protein n=1 Tax=Shinella sp. M31 TaxID=3368615 RepID=UPI003BA09A35
MSKLTRSTALAQSVLAAIGGRGRSLEEERPEDNEPEETTAEADDDTPEAETSEDENSAESEEDAPEAEAEETDETSANTSRIRRAEQSRIRAILTHPAAASNPGLASELAFGATVYSAKSAGALLASAGGGSRLADKMQGRSPQLGSGGGAPKSEKQTVLAAVGSTIKAMHGRNRKGA